MKPRDGHVRMLPLHVANKIAAGEVVERPASVVKELVENAIDAGAKTIAVTITQGGRKLVSVRDDGCGMSRDDAVMSLERQATSKILDVDDIEEIDTLGFRGEAIPSIASVSRFSITTRRAESDEGTFLQVNAGTLAEVRAAGCPAGTLVEVRDLFCNVPARKKFLRAYTTEEGHVKAIFTQHALAHPDIGFSLTIDGRELHRLAPAKDSSERILELFGREFLDSCVRLESATGSDTVSVTGFIERPNLFAPTRRDQYVFVNGRPASAPAIQYALREAYPRKQGDVRPAAILFLTLPPSQVDVNVHPTKREVRFRDHVAVRQAVMSAVESAFSTPATQPQTLQTSKPLNFQTSKLPNLQTSKLPTLQPSKLPNLQTSKLPTLQPSKLPNLQTSKPLNFQPSKLPNLQTSNAQPTIQELPMAASESGAAKPWQWFKFLAVTDSGYVLVETDAGLVTINPHAARERIAFERLTQASGHPGLQPSQALLIPEVVQLSPVDCSRVLGAAEIIRSMGFQFEEFGANTLKIEAVPQLIGSLSPATVLSTIARDLSESGTGRGEKWREELIAKSIARSFAGSAMPLNAEGATKLVEELCSCRMPYVCPRAKPVMIFTSTRELDRKFDRR